jgi:hypothetical protein
MPTPEVVLRVHRCIDYGSRRLPRRWDIVEVPRGEMVEGFEAVFDVGGSRTVKPNLEGKSTRVSTFWLYGRSSNERI